MGLWLDELFAKAQVHCDDKPWQTDLNHGIFKRWISAQSESRFMCYSYCYIRWCPLMTSIVMSLFQLKHVICYLRFLRSGCLNVIKPILPQLNMFTVNLQTSLKAMLFIFTSIGYRISLNASYWHEGCGVMCLLSLYMRLLDLGHM